MPTRLLSFAGTTLAINYHGRIAARVVDYLYQHVPALKTGFSPLTYHLRSDDSAAKVRLQREETLLYEGNCAGTVAELLLGDSCNQLAAHCRTGTLFHAAALAGRGHTLILPGRSGAGKSTLTAWLVSQGFDYLTDELVFIPWQTKTIQAFTRPLSLKKPARVVLKEQFNFENLDLLSSAYVDLVPTALFSSNGREIPLEGDNPVIIFPHYQSHGSFEWQPLSKAQAGLALMSQLINARNLPGHGFGEVTRLAGCLPAYSVNYSSFEQLIGQLDLVSGSASASTE